MLEPVILLDKPKGWTPLQALEHLQELNPDYSDVRLAYAGRLDPMAEGLLVVLVDEECKKRDYYQKLDKTYEFEMILGISTDSDDLLGKVLEVKPEISIERSSIEQQLVNFRGEIEQLPPVYSAVRVNAKPLFWWVKNNKLDEINIPARTVTIKSLNILDNSVITSEELLEHVSKLIPNVNGDFRQSEILEEWMGRLNDTEYRFSLVKLEANVVSGTYIRALARDIGKSLGAPAMAYSIRRTEVGDFDLLAAQKIVTSTN